MPATVPPGPDPETDPNAEATSLGRSSASLDRALGLAGEIEDDELLRRMRSGG